MVSSKKLHFGPRISETKYHECRLYNENATYVYYYQICLGYIDAIDNWSRNLSGPFVYSNGENVTYEVEMKTSFMNVSYFSL
jgi:hypothetical protein